MLMLLQITARSSSLIHDCSSQPEPYWGHRPGPSMPSCKKTLASRTRVRSSSGQRQAVGQRAAPGSRPSGAHSLSSIVSLRPKRSGMCGPPASCGYEHTDVRHTAGYAFSDCDPPGERNEHHGRAGGCTSMAVAEASWNRSAYDTPLCWSAMSVSSSSATVSPAAPPAEELCTASDTEFEMDEEGCSRRKRHGVRVCASALRLDQSLKTQPSHAALVRFNAHQRWRCAGSPDRTGCCRWHRPSAATPR